MSLVKVYIIKSSLYSSLNFDPSLHLWTSLYVRGQLKIDYFRELQVPIKNLLRLATSTSSFSSIALQQGKVDSQLAAVPLSAWALANLVYLASSSGKSISEVKEFSGQFVTGLVYQDYVQGLCCLLEDLKPWIEANRQRRRAQKLANEDDEEKGLDDTKSVGVG